jgi:PqqD family protein of HPr-rel-A system
MQKKYTRNNDTIQGRLNDELVMMDIEKGKYFSLNPVATRIWDLLEKPLTVDELCQSLTEEYEVEEAECHAEVQELLDEMMKMGLIHENGKKKEGNGTDPGGKGDDEEKK